ncbi:MAG: response regulator [Desulfobacterales bacterium]|nr:response regulator [Desulfobacterales bacterium]
MEDLPKKILVIDDESVSRAIIGRMLEKLGFEVMTAADGAAGLEAYRQHAPDMAMVDLFMPGIDGFNVLATIQAQSPETPVIVISATDRIGDVIRALRLGAWDFITKPVKDSVFLENTVFRAFEKAALTVENRLFRERIQAIVEAVPCGIVVVDSAGQTIVDVNPMAAEMVGLPVGDMLGKKCPGFIYPDEPPACVAADPDSTLVQPEHILLKSDGSRIPIHKTVTRTIIENRACVIESFVDISEQQQAQLELVERKKMQGVLEMAGAVCHEMNQPLQVVSGFCELIMMDLDENSPFYEQFQTIRSQIGEMGRITGQLMGITRYRTKEHLADRIIDIDEASDQKQ